MCIIIAKEKGKQYNEAELISAIDVAKIHNSDGAGFAFKRGNSETIYLSKGYLTYYENMLDRLRELNITEDDELIVHLRYATAGNVDSANCHPFVVSSNDELVKSDEIETNLPVMAHNGTFYDYSYTKDENSDTVNFIKEFASKEGVLDALATIKEASIDRITSLMDTNRICAIFPGDKPMLRIGDWNKKNKEDACFVYSNYYHIYPDSARAYGDKNPHKHLTYNNYSGYYNYDKR